MLRRDNKNQPRLESGVATFYVTGGTLRADAPSYVERQADKDLFEGLLRGDFSYVLTSRQMGKSSLMVRTVNRLRHHGKHVAALDLTAIGQNLTPDQWYDGLLLRLARQLRMEDEVEEFWAASQKLSPVQRFFTALSQVVLPRLTQAGRYTTTGNSEDVPRGEIRDNLPHQPDDRSQDCGLVIFVDEVDTVRSLPFSTDEFFAAIREVYNRRAEGPEFQRLTFCLLGVAAPGDLIQDTRLTPFNIGLRIPLDDFAPAQAASLARGLESHRLGRPGAQALIQRILYWTHGHPYLTQRLCRVVADRNQGAEGGFITVPKDVDRLCDDLFFSQSALEMDDNLVFVRERILRTDGDLASLLDVYLKVRRGKRVWDDMRNPLMNSLKLAGILRVENGYLVERNRIYKRVFDPNWVHQTLPFAEKLRQAAAYKRGVARTTLIAILIIGTVLLIARQQARIASDQIQRAAQLQQILARLNVANGMQLVTHGDWLGALPLFAEALLLEPDAKHENTHRTRLASILTQSPPVEQMWFQSVNMVYGEFGTNSDQVLISAPDGRFRLYAVRTGNPISAPFGQGIPEEQASLSADGQSALTSSDKTPQIRIWDVKTGAELLVLTNEGAVNFARFSPDGSSVAAALDRPTNNVVLWDLSRRRARAFAGHTEAARSVNFDRTGTRLVSASQDRRALIWDIKSGTILRQLMGHESWVYYAAFRPDGNFVATASFDRTARIWNCETGAEAFRVSHETDAVRSVEFSPDGASFVTSGWDYSARLWDFNARKLIPPIIRDNHRVMHAAFSPDNRRVLTVNFEGTVRVWNRNISMPPPARGPLNLSYDGSRSLNQSNQVMIVSDAISGETLSRWRIGTNAVADTLFGEHGAILWTLSVSDRAKSGPCIEAQAWDASKGRPMMQPAHWDESMTNCVCSPEGFRLAAYSDHRLSVWDARTGQELRKWDFPAADIKTACFDPSGEHLAVGIDKSVMVYRIKDGALLHRPLPHPMNVTHLAYNPKGTLLVTTWSDSTLREAAAQIWNAENGLKFGSLLKHRDGVLYAVFSPDGERLVTCSEDQSAILWSVASGRPLAPPLKHEDQVTYASFSQDGRWLVTTGHDGTVRVWDAFTGELVTLPYREAPKNRVVRAQFVMDGKHIFTMDNRGDHWLWELPTDRRPAHELMLSARLLSSQENHVGGVATMADSTTELGLEKRLQASELGRVYTTKDFEAIWDAQHHK